MVLRRGDPDRGALIVQVADRGVAIALLQRRLADDFTYRWQRFEVPERGTAAFLADQSRIDPDLWAIELDIPDAERFVAEMTASP